jgi:hypothetical protein
MRSGYVTKELFDLAIDITKSIPGLCGTYTHCLHCGAPDREASQ